MKSMASQQIEPEPEEEPGGGGGALLPPTYSVGGMAYFGYRLAVTAKRFDRKFVEILESHSALTLPQWRVVAQLGLAEPGTVRSLAERAEVDRSETSRALATLEANGFVRREPNNRDQRSPLFLLTARGRETFERVRSPAAEFIRGIVAAVDDEDIVGADRVLQAIWRACER